MKIFIPERKLVPKDDGATISLFPGEFDVDDEMGRFLIEQGAAEAVPLRKETKRGSTTG